ncbi:MAG: SRPBCC family protein [Chloroflexota bacterium]
MPAVEHSIDIAAPIDRVFEAVTDPRRAREWNPSVEGIDDFSGEPVTAGSTWTQVVKLAGKTVRLRARVLAFEPPHTGIIEITGPYTGRVWTRCEAIPGGTRLTQGIEAAAPRGLLGLIGGRVIAATMSRQLKTSLARQRDVLEGASSGSRPA